MRLITGNLTKIAKAEINFACRKQVTAEVRCIPSLETGIIVFLNDDYISKRWLSCP
jgi:hypothetical protein